MKIGKKKKKKTTHPLGLKDPPNCCFAGRSDNCNVSNLTLIMYIVEEVLGWPSSWITRNSSTGTYFPVISIQNLDFLASLFRL